MSFPSSSSSCLASWRMACICNSGAGGRGISSAVFLRRTGRERSRGEWGGRAFVVRCRDGGKGGRATKLVTFVGKGGAGKTLAALLAAHHYASTGLRTCLVVQSQDPTADLLLGHKLGSAPTLLCGGALTALRLEATKMLLEPLAQVKKADAQLNFSQGAIDEVVGEELSVIPGMDPYLALGALERLTEFAGGLFRVPGKSEAHSYDVVVYDGPSSEDIFRMFGVADKARYYLRLVRSVAEKTDAGRVALPSVLRLVESAFFADTAGSRSTAEIWNAADRLLGKVVEAYSDPNKFTCFLVIDPRNPLTVEAALRYWGCAMQAGICVAGVLHSPSALSSDAKEKFAPLCVSELPNISTASPEWERAVGGISKEARSLLDGGSQSNRAPKPVVFDRSSRTVTLFLPGFHKSEVKLSQWRGGSELLVEAGDQRRIISLPPEIRGKVAGAKFLDKTLVVTIKSR